MKKRKILYLAGLGLTASLALTGCKKSDTKKEPKVYGGIEAIEYYTEMPETKTLDSHQHILFKKYSIMTTENGKEYHTDKVAFYDQGSLVVPDGYEVISVTGVSSTYGTTNPTTYYVVWYTNTTPVEVKPVLNEETKCYDYSEFGTPIELEKTLS